MKDVKFTCKVQIRDKDTAYSTLTPPDDSSRALLQELLKYCFEKHNGYVSVQLSPPRRPRTTGKGSQSHHINGHIQQLSIETGFNFSDMKKYMKELAVSRGYPMELNDNGDPMMDPWDNPVGKSESDISVEEAKLLIDTIHQFAAENGIRLVEG